MSEQGIGGGGASSAACWACRTCCALSWSHTVRESSAGSPASEREGLQLRQSSRSASSRRGATARPPIPPTDPRRARSHRVLLLKHRLQKNWSSPVESESGTYLLGVLLQLQLQTGLSHRMSAVQCYDS
eukprot:scaffold117995_cov32-Tisochrysis_lutea.AAC.3